MKIEGGVRLVLHSFCLLCLFALRCPSLHMDSLAEVIVVAITVVVAVRASCENKEGRIRPAGL